MNFAIYFKQAWSNHATDAEGVAGGFAAAAKLVESNEELAQLANLVTHVLGEHLAKWREGIELLETLKTHPLFFAWY